MQRYETDIYTWIANVCDSPCLGLFLSRSSNPNIERCRELFQIEFRDIE